ncbi:hypothetical protein [Novosphingobium sp.]|uniref:hypothetical protein n=1 Tax=Novosphingobium sp. TaxID=1874826 RepID=UPI0025E26017|nr:hypothetical protein [Novosphingobium sp.]
MRGDYLRFALHAFSRTGNFSLIHNGAWISEEDLLDTFNIFLSRSFSHFGFEVDHSIFKNDLMQLLVEYKSEHVLEFEGDRYTGKWFRINEEEKNRNAINFLNTNEVALRLSRLGESATKAALSRVIAEYEAAAHDGGPDGALSETVYEERQLDIPASDRIVSIDDNQRDEIDEAAEGVRQELCKVNAFDGDAALHERFLAQLAAGRELIRSHSVRIYLIYETLIKMLVQISEKYKDTALGVVAKKLLELLVEHIVGK